MRIEIIYITLGILIGLTITFILLDNFYQKELNRINTEYRKNMEEMIIVPEINFIENNTCPETECTKVICKDIPSFMAIAESNSDHEYILDEYDCTEFSRQLLKDLRKFGWKTELVQGYFYPDGSNECSDEKNLCMHDWVIVEVPVESVKGIVIEPDVYDTYYSLNRRG